MIALVYRYEALGAVPLGLNAAVMALLYGLGQTKLTLVLNFSRVFIFRIPVFWFLQHCTNFGEASVGIVMMVSNISVAVAAGITALVVIRRFKREHALS
jgi:Na+-driven multidrug efflux pump